MPPAKRNVVVVTGSRAEFGLLQTVMHAIEKQRGLAMKTVVTGLHLRRNTWRDVQKAGFDIAAKVPMQKQGEDGRLADVQAVGRGIYKLGETYARLKPFVVLILGDRVEAFAAASAASIGGIRVAHVHGGDRAEGVADEAMRHAISKLAHLHFPGSPQSRNRLMKMGEADGHVFAVGSPAADGLRDVKPATNGPELIVMQHPIGEIDIAEKQWMSQTLDAVADYDTLVMAPNSDPGCRGIHAALRARRIEPVEHMPRHKFLANLKAARAIIGNSSAGLIEAAVLKTPCVNVGPRQAGRETCRNVIHCDYGCHNIRDALARALDLDLTRLRHPYGNGTAGERIAEVLATFDPADIPIRKRNTY